MRGIFIAGLFSTLLIPAAADAQLARFRGFRIEGNIGADRFKAEGDKNTKLGYGGAAGFDGVLADKIVVGVEGSYWRPNKGTRDCASFGGGTLCQSSSHELGAAVRVGYLITPALLVFGKGGYVNDTQRNSFAADNGLFYVNGAIVGPGYAARTHGSTDGYQAGGGVEFSLTPMFYVSGQYVYSRYDDHTSRQRALAGVGLRFR
ncbi:outer membrane protein [Sphingomonas morindae]|uniref:Porin family protein n=1 Tax=Sphingomonas morindae TaxID=1541170 RepID=A0ABY4X986_9SPHN|nr:outer membrane beta-barrel protein [Sphingomonas morindae]USI73443.1 porin family protein [Sphingomonas morindae]